MSDLRCEPLWTLMDMQSDFWDEKLHTVIDDKL